ncbi:unnamed protein product [Penicillium nalgiovense]|nr:unnamed protein product [Penicillium nalgiovense]
MAEVIGIVSGAITFATVLVQIGNTITTLKECYDNLRDAPDDLRKLVQEIELFGFILTDIGEDLSQSPNPASGNNKHALKSFTLCKDAAKELDIVCTDIVREIKSPNHLRRSLKSVRIVLQKGKIEKHKTHLKHAIQLLMLSQQCYTRAVIQAQPQAVIERIVHHDISCSCAGNSKSTTTLKKAESCAKQTKSIISQDKRTKFSQSSSYRWRLSLPRWITSEVLEVAGIKAPGGWNWYFRSYSIIPLNSKASSYVMGGNIQELQDMFASRQASPFDLIYLPNGNLFSLLEWVTRRNRNEMIAFLLDQGTDPNSLFDPPLWSIVSYAKTKKVESLIPSMRVLFRHIDISYESDEEAAISVLGRFHGTPEEFLFLQQHVCPSFYRLRKRFRIRVALRIGAFYVHNWSVPELFRVILGTHILEPNDFKFDQELGSTLIHCAARGMGASERDFREGTSADSSDCDAWGNLCHKFFCVRIDIHDLVDGKTPYHFSMDISHHGADP